MATNLPTLVFKARSTYAKDNHNLQVTIPMDFTRLVNLHKGDDLEVIISQSKDGKWALNITKKETA